MKPGDRLQTFLKEDPVGVSNEDGSTWGHVVRTVIEMVEEDPRYQWMPDFAKENYILQLLEREREYFAPPEVWAIDTETTLILPGCTTPLMVCTSIASDSKEESEECQLFHHYFDAQELLEKLKYLFENKHTTFANAPYDVSVLLRWRPELLQPILGAYEDGRIHDVQIRQKLADIALGVRTRSRYALDVLVSRHFNTIIAKDKWRKDYDKLFGLGFEEWPTGAIDYAMKDALMTLAVHKQQDLEYRGVLVKNDALMDSMDIPVEERGNFPGARENFGLSDEPRQVRKHFALYMMRTWGMRTDREALEVKRMQVHNEWRVAVAKAKENGFIKKSGTKDGTAVQIALANELETHEIEWTPEGLEAIDTIFDRRYQVEWAKKSAKLQREEPEWLASLDPIERHTALRLTDEESDALRANIERMLHDRAKGSGDYISTEAHILKRCKSPALRDYANYQSLNSLLTGSLKDIERGVHLPIQPNYEPLRETGRTACTGPNVQNQRREPGIRECYIAREGYALVGADYGMAELHAISTYNTHTRHSLDSVYMAKALNEGKDPHCMLGAQLVGLMRDYYDRKASETDDPELSASYMKTKEASWPESISTYDTFKAAKDSGHKAAKTIRNLAKAGNFGYPGGCSPKTFVVQAEGYGLTIDEEVALIVQKAWFSTWFEMNGYMRAIRWNISRAERASMAQPNAYGRSFFQDNPVPDVQQLWSNRRRKGQSFTAMANTIFQGLAADMAGLALWMVVKATFDPQSPLWGSHLWAFIHDELIIESPIDKVHEAALELQRLMELAGEVWCPFCPPKANPAAMNRWSKKVEEPTYDENGRIIPTHVEYPINLSDASVWEIEIPDYSVNL